MLPSHEVRCCVTAEKPVVHASPDPAFARPNRIVQLGIGQRFVHFDQIEDLIVSDAHGANTLDVGRHPQIKHQILDKTLGQ